MTRTIVHPGERYTIAFAIDASGRSPGAEFFFALEKADRARLMALFTMAGRGCFKNKEKFGDLGKGLYEFKSFQIRMPYAYAPERAVIVISHGFIKKRDKAPKEEIDRARRILEEDKAQSKLEIVRKAKST